LLHLLRSGIVQVFGRRQHWAHHALRRPASEKRQGTKSREAARPGAPRATMGFWGGSVPRGCWRNARRWRDCAVPGGPADMVRQFHRRRGGDRGL